MKFKVNYWCVITGVALAFPTIVLFCLNTNDYETLTNQLAVTVVVGVVLAGVGMTMRAASHNRNKLIDGVGKIIGLIGWSVSLVAVIVNQLNGTSVPHADVWIGYFNLALLFAAILMTFVPLFLHRREDPAE